LHLDDGVLHLTAPRRSTVPENWKPLHRELSDAGYELRLKLNDRVDESRLSAGLEDGVLTLVLPVKETVKPRSISLQ
jgi:HSP20 family protein